MVKITLEGFPELLDAFRTLGERCEDLRPYWPRFETAFYLRELNLFAGQGEGYWVPLSPSYEKWKKNAAPGQPLMVLSGSLRESLTDAKGEGAVVNEQPRSLEIGTSVPYAAFHQTGTSRMPARPPIVVDEKLVDEMNFAALVMFGDEAKRMGFTVR